MQGNFLLGKIIVFRKIIRSLAVSALLLLMDFEGIYTWIFHKYRKVCLLVLFG